MGLTYYPIRTLPEPGTIVWCKFPKARDKGPAESSRPTLVRQHSIHIDGNGVEFGAVKVTFGTGNIKWSDPQLDFIIDDIKEWRALGLHKPKAFHLAAAYTKVLVWCEEYFAAPEYVMNTPVVIGRLSADLEARLRDCMARRATQAQ